MSAPNERAGANPAIMVANSTATKGFQRAKVRAAFRTMASGKVEGDKAAEIKQQAALNVCKLAHGFLTSNSGTVEHGTIVDGWRTNMATLAMELATDGCNLAELTPADPKKGTAATARFTGYGNNVASIAKGCIEFSVNPDAIENVDEPSYRETRKAVEAKRAEFRRAKDPALAALEDAKAELDEVWKSVKEKAYGFNNAEVIRLLTAELQSITFEDATTDAEIAELIADEVTEENTAPEVQAAA